MGLVMIGSKSASAIEDMVSVSKPIIVHIQNGNILRDVKSQFLTGNTFFVTPPP